VDDGNTAGVTVTSAIASGGSVVLNTTGPTVLTHVQAARDAAGDNVTVTTRQGDLTVVRVQAGANNGAIPLNAGGAILAGTSPTSSNVTAGTVTLSADGNIGVVTDAATGAGTPLLVSARTIDRITSTGDNRVVAITNPITSGTWTLGANSLS